MKINSAGNKSNKKRTEDFEKEIASLKRKLKKEQTAASSLKVELEKYKTILHSSFQFVGLLDLKGILLESNLSSLNFAGVKPEDVNGKPFWKTVWWKHSPELRKKLKESIRKASKGEFVRFEATHSDSQNDLRIIDFSLKPVTDKEGNIIYLIPEGRDITEKKNIEQKLIESEERYRNLADATEEGIGFSDNGMISDINDQLSAMFGYTRNEMIGKPVMSLIAPESQADVIAHIRSGSKIPYEHFALKKDGTKITVEIHGRNIQSAKGIRRAVIVKDITEKKKMESELKETESRYRNLSSATFEGIVFTEDNIIIDLNEQAAEMLGYTTSELIGKHILANLVPEYRPSVEANLKARSEQSQESKVRKKDGNEIFVETRARNAVSPSGKNIRIISVRDITEQKNTQAELLNEKNFVNSIVETVKSILVVLDKRGRIVRYNKTAEQVFGYSFAEVKGRIFWDIFVPESEIEARIRLFENLNENPNPSDYVNQWVAKNGEIKYINWSTNFLYNETGEVDYVIGTGLDITEKMVIEKNLKESESRHRMIIEQSGFLAYDLDIKTNVNTWSGNALAVTGYSLDVFQYNSVNDWANMVHPDDREETVRKLEECFKTGENYNVEYRYRQADGSYKYLLDKGTFLKADDGTPYRMLGVMSDISQRKASEMTLRKSELRLRAVIERSVDGIVLFDERGIVIEWNHAMEQIYRLKKQEVIGKYLWDVYLRSLSEKSKLVYPTREAKEGILNILKSSGSELAHTEYELEFENHLNELRIINSYTILANLGNEKVYGEIVSEITQRKLAERALKESDEKLKYYNTELEEKVRERTIQLEASNRELEAFSYSVSHDLRAPLRGMDGFSQALLEDYADKLDETARNYLNRIRNSTQKMAELIDDLLKLSKVTRVEIQLNRIDITEIVQEIMIELQQENPERIVNWKIHDLLKARADISLLKIVLRNLIGNAWKFTSKHPVANIEVGSFVKDGKTVYFVKDDGAGFDMTYSEKLFKAFQRLHALNDFDGTGIGLAIVGRIISRHGGRVWAEGVPEKGATFYFTLSS